MNKRELLPLETTLDDVRDMLTKYRTENVPLSFYEELTKKFYLLVGKKQEIIKR